MKKNIERDSNFKRVAWDSHIFRYEVAEITVPNLSKTELRETLNRLAKNNVTLVYWIRDIPYEDLLEQGKIVDTKITYVYEFGEENYVTNNSINSYIHKPLDNELLSLALQSGQYSRFNTDTNFRREEYERLYSTWIQRSLNGEIAKDVLVYQHNGKKLGLLTLDFKGNNSIIGLLAVDKEMRDRGIGQQLITEAFYQARKKSIQTISVTTQADNKPACNLYQKMGFKEREKKYVYHFWL